MPYFARSLELGLLLILQTVKSALLFEAGIAIDSVWPHRHRACMHLLVISLLEPPSNLITSKLVPPLRLSKPLPAIFGVCLRALAAQQLHSAAISDFAHGVSSLDLDYPHPKSDLTADSRCSRVCKMGITLLAFLL